MQLVYSSVPCASLLHFHAFSDTLGCLSIPNAPLQPVYSPCIPATLLYSGCIAVQRLTEMCLTVAV